MIAFDCPACNAHLEKPVSEAGTKFPCPKCGQRLKVPAPASDRTMVGQLTPSGGLLAGMPAKSAPVRPAEGWYARRDQRQIGPISFAELKERAESGRLFPTDFVRCGTSGEWERADSLEELFGPSEQTLGAAGQVLPSWRQGGARVANLPPAVWVAGGLFASVLLGGIGLWAVGLVFFKKPEVTAVNAASTVADPVAAKGATTPVASASTAENANIEYTTQQIVERFGPSVALITGPRQSGSGFIVRPDVVVTNAHVINNSMIDTVRVMFPSGPDKGSVAIPVKGLLYENVKRDLAILRVPTELPPLKVADHHQFHSGQSITVIGSPGVGNGVVPNAVTSGILSAQMTIAELPWYQLSISINPGNSGGPVFDATGKVIAAVTLKASRQEGIAMGVPANDIAEAIERATAASAKEVEETTSRHNLELVFRRVARAGSIYQEGLALYVQAMLEAEQAKKTANDGLKVVSQRIDKEVQEKGEDSLAHVRPSVMTVTADRTQPEAIRVKLADMWTSYNDLKKAFDQPFLPVPAYQTRVMETRDRFTKQMEGLKLLVGVDPLAE